MSKDKLESNSSDGLSNDSIKMENLDQRLSVVSISHSLTAHPTSYIETLLNLLKANIGCGILAMGDAFKNGGLFLSPMLTIFIGIIAVYNQHLLIICSRSVKNKLKLQKNPGFSKTVKLSFQSGPQTFRKYSIFFRNTVISFIVITQLGFCCIYILYVSKSIQQIMKWYNVDLGVDLSLLITTVPIMISSLVRNLKFIARLSALANIFMLTGLSVVLYYCSTELPPIKTRYFISDWSSIPLFFGTTIFSFEGISLVLPLEQEMKNSNRFSSTFGVLNVGMVIVTSLLIATGFMGYLKFGEKVLGSLTLNLPENFILTKFVVISMMFGILSTYTLQFYVPVGIIWPKLEKKIGPFKSPVTCEMIFRILLVFVTFMAADVIPQLEIFISLLGAVASTFLALVFPPICHMAVTKFDDYGRYHWRMVMNIITLILGLLGFITGTYASIYAIFTEFHK